MWKLMPGRECKKCGADWLPFYAFKLTRTKKVFVTFHCKICYLDYKNAFNRKWRKKYLPILKKRHNAWRKKNMPHLRKYARDRWAKKRELNSYLPLYSPGF